MCVDDIAEEEVAVELDEYGDCSGSDPDIGV